VKAALKAGVKKVVALSTDKAERPINLYGASKLVMEKLIIAANNISGGRCHFSVVRFGNIWNSRGSVIDRWNELSKQHKPAPITDPNATRFYMSMEEVIDLVLRALVSDRSLLLPADMKAFKLGDLAEAMEVETQLVGLPLFERADEFMNGISSADV